MLEPFKKLIFIYPKSAEASKHQTLADVFPPAMTR